MSFLGDPSGQLEWPVSVGKRQTGALRPSLEDSEKKLVKGSKSS
jgi:hypothetical protein